MPPPRKVDLLPEELRDWLREALVARGFGDYERLAEDLNARLEAGGLELRIGKSALHVFGQEFREYAEAERRAKEEIRAFLTEQNLASEIDATKALFQQLTTLQWRLQMALSGPEALVDPRGMKDLTTALNNLIRSTELRARIVEEDRKAQSARLDAAVASGDIDAEAAAKARRIMGFAA